MNNVLYTGRVLTGHSGRFNTEVPQCSADRPLCPVSDQILAPLCISTANTRSTFQVLSYDASLFTENSHRVDSKPK